MEKLKVGQSFEVVECMVNVGSLSLEGNTGVIIYENMYTEVICRNAWDKNEYGTVALMMPFELKPIGKLTITKLKH